MKVKELIELLKALDQEKDILISAKSGEAYDVELIKYDEYLEDYIIKNRR